MRTTHTYVELKVSTEAWSEIAELLSKAGYDHAFEPGGRIDMSGIAIYCDGEGGLRTPEQISPLKHALRDCPDGLEVQQKGVRVPFADPNPQNLDLEEQDEHI